MPTLKGKQKAQGLMGVLAQRLRRWHEGMGLDLGADRRRFEI